jgi:hypothetical protein
MLLGFLVACSGAKQPTDSQIIGDVVTRIQASPQLTRKDLAVSSHNGLVTLRGTVPSDAERTAAATVASQAPGVKTVINDLFIDGPATAQSQQTATDPVIGPQQSANVAESVPAPQRNSKPSGYTKRVSESRASESDNPDAKTAKANTPQSQQQISGLPITVENTSGSNVATVPALPAIPSTPAVKPVQLVRVGSGAALNVRLIDNIDSEKNQVGDSFRGTLDSPVYVDGQEVVPAGAGVMGKITQLDSSGRFTGRPQIGLELTSLSVNGRAYSIQTNQYTRQGGSQGSRTAKSVGGGAALGALIGAIAGGGKGAAIGAAVGAAGGGGVEAARGRQQLHLGSEARLNFRLENSISVIPASNLDRGSHNDGNSNYESSASIYNRDQQQQNDTYSNDAPTPVDPPDGDRPVLKRRPPPPNNPD